MNLSYWNIQISEYKTTVSIFDILCVSDSQKPFTLVILLTEKYPHYWRMKALDQLSLLEDAIKLSCSSNPDYHRPAKQDLRYHLIRLTKKGGPLDGCDTRLINQFVDAYQHGRHEPTPQFLEKEFNHYMNLMNKIRNFLKTRKELPDKRGADDFQFTEFSKQKQRLKNYRLAKIEDQNETSI